MQILDVATLLTTVPDVVVLVMPMGTDVVVLVMPMGPGDANGDDGLNANTRSKTVWAETRAHQDLDPAPAGFTTAGPPWASFHAVAGSGRPVSRTPVVSPYRPSLRQTTKCESLHLNQSTHRSTIATSPAVPDSMGDNQPIR